MLHSSLVLGHLHTQRRTVITSSVCQVKDQRRVLVGHGPDVGTAGRAKTCFQLNGAAHPFFA